MHNASASPLRFALTPWPAIPLPELPILRSEDVTIGPRRTISARPDRDASEFVRPSVVFRELERVDPIDDESTLKFIKTHGLVKWRARSRGLPFFPRTHHVQGLVQIADAALQLRVVRACARHYRVAQDGESGVEVWREHGFTNWDDAIGKIDTPADAVEAFTRSMNACLRPFHARVGGEPSTEVDLISALSLQIFNAVIEQRSFRKCANETCPFDFDVEHAARRYCSTSCENAQNQRQHRRRRRAAGT